MGEQIFQGLAISSMAREVASLLLSRMALPILHYLTAARHLKGGQMRPELSPNTTVPRRSGDKGGSR
jgi:hypothetical protein